MPGLPVRLSAMDKNNNKAEAQPANEPAQTINEVARLLAHMPATPAQVNDYETDTAHMQPYRLPCGGVGWRAIPIVKENRLNKGRDNG